MNKISMSKTCLCNFSYKKATGFLQQPVTTEGEVVKPGTMEMELEMEMEMEIEMGIHSSLSLAVP